MVRRRRKVRKLRGSRTMGGGSVKKRRGAGHRGGRGMAGSHKHKWTAVIKRDRGHFGKRGFTHPIKARKVANPINVGDLDQRLDKLLEEKIAKREGDKFVVEAGRLGVDKVMGGGKVTRPIKVVAKEFSESAKKKLEGAGGEAVVG